MKEIREAITTFGDYGEILEPLCIVSGNIKWFNCCASLVGPQNIKGQPSDLAI